VTSSRPGYWADADMLVAGLGWDQWTARHFASMRNNLALTSVSDDQLKSMLLQQPNLSDTEQRTHVSLWAMLSAPLIAGNDIRSMTPQTRDILTNRDAIAVDQDPKVAPPHALATDPRVFVKPLSDGSVAVAFFNSGEDPVTMGTTTGDIGLAKAPCYTVRDLWSHGENTSAGPLGSGALPAHATVLLRVSGGCR
jgi:alpha-galactosidase